MLLLAHISDTHLDGSERNAERTRRVMDHLNGLRRPVDAILVTGDIADHGLPDEYAEAAELLVSPSPVLRCPGNHDVREAYRAVLLDQPPSAGPVNEAHLLGGALFAMCDSSIPGRADGLLADETLEWLDETLAAPPADTPAFVCFHHPPVVLHEPGIDAIRQSGAERLAAVLGRHPQVVALLCGHAHTAAASSFAGRPVLVAPGVVSTLRLAWEHGEWLDYDAPPGVAFHVLDEEQGLTTHYRAVT
jgi:3',5'-cyclic-AMP phosphodiesterase